MRLETSATVCPCHLFRRRQMLLRLLWNWRQTSCLARPLFLFISLPSSFFNAFLLASILFFVMFPAEWSARWYLCFIAAPFSWLCSVHGLSHLGIRAKRHQLTAHFLWKGMSLDTASTEPPPVQFLQRLCEAPPTPPSTRPFSYAAVAAALFSSSLPATSVYIRCGSVSPSPFTALLYLGPYQVLQAGLAVLQRGP